RWDRLGGVEDGYRARGPHRDRRHSRVLVVAKFDGDPVVGERDHGAPTTFPTGRGAELLVSQFVMRAAITHVRRPALTIRSADRNVGTGATGWGTKRALRRHRCPPGESGARRRMPVTYPGPTTMGTPTARRASQAGGGSFFGPERLAVPPHHAGVNVDDEPPARRVAWVAADRPRVGHEGTGCEPVVRLARDRPHRARSGAVVNEEGRFMRMADKSERSQGAARQDSGGRRLSEEPEQGVARRAVPAVDAVA